MNIVVRKVLAVALLLLVSWGLTSCILFTKKTGISPYLFYRLVFDNGIPLTQTDGRTNVLILGIGGGDHAGSDLTDTMIVLSLDVNAQTAAMIPIPRDTWSDTLRDKVNSAYHYGEEKKKGGGLVLAKTIAEDVVGIPIHYSIVVDFFGFKQVIDMLGGIDVVVTQAFTDTKYPKPGMEKSTCPGDPTNACVYETVHFDRGRQHMDGNRALIYVRSRHAAGDEGTDFARSRRQQEVIQGLKVTLMSPSRWLRIGMMSKLIEALSDTTDMDMNIGQLLTVGRIYMNIKEKDIKKISLDSVLTQGEEYLYNGLYVLVPIEDWKNVHTAIKEQVPGE